MNSESDLYLVSKFAKGRVAVFIDAANIFYSQRTLKWHIDYEKLASYLRNTLNLIGIFYYTGHVGSLEKQQKFLKKLISLGYHVTSKEIKFIRVSGSTDIPKGNLDVELALDAYRMRDEFDTIILFSGDSDFAYLLEMLKQGGKNTIVVSMRGHISRELLERAKYIDLPKLRSVIEKIKEPDKPAPEV